MTPSSPEPRAHLPLFSPSHLPLIINARQGEPHFSLRPQYQPLLLPFSAAKYGRGNSSFFNLNIFCPERPSSTFSALCTSSATPGLRRIEPNQGLDCAVAHCCRRRCPYPASVRLLRCACPVSDISSSGPPRRSPFLFGRPVAQSVCGPKCVYVRLYARTLVDISRYLYIKELAAPRIGLPRILSLPFFLFFCVLAQSV